MGISHLSWLHVLSRESLGYIHIVFGISNQDISGHRLDGRSQCFPLEFSWATISEADVFPLVLTKTVCMHIFLCILCRNFLFYTLWLKIPFFFLERKQEINKTLIKLSFLGFLKNRDPLST